MKLLLLLACLYSIALLAPLTLPLGAANPIAKITIDIAPSVVAYQGSSQAHARLIFSPMGRSLSYVIPAGATTSSANETNLNNTLQRSEKLHTSLDVLDINPIYVKQ